MPTALHQANTRPARLMKLPWFQAKHGVSQETYAHRCLRWARQEALPSYQDKGQLKYLRLPSMGGCEITGIQALNLLMAGHAYRNEVGYFGHFSTFCRDRDSVQTQALVCSSHRLTTVGLMHFGNSAQINKRPLLSQHGCVRGKKNKKTMKYAGSALQQLI